jgi:CheY-like chemotaxis protein
MNILLIEDDPTDLKLFSAILRTSGHQVQAKASAEKTLEEIKQRRPQVILLDLKLPGMDGLTLARQLKQDPETRQIPIVAVTAAPELFTREQALEAGCDAFIVKPVDTRKLSETMNEVARQKIG